MAACGSLQHMFENPIPENPSSLIESLSSSWKQIKPLKPHVDHSFTEIFGELHFKENPDLLSSSSFSSSSSSSPSPAFPIDSITQGKDSGQNDDKFLSNGYTGSYHKRSESFSSMKSESLQLCTEGLGFESFDNVEDLKIEFQDTWQNHSDNNNNYYDNNNNNNDNLQTNNNISSYSMREKVYVRSGHSYCQYRKGKTNGRAFPPPISCIGRTGKPWVCFQSYRQDGRFVLKEIRIPTQEFLHACREDGRLRLCFVQPSEGDDDDIIEEDDAGEEEGEEETGGVGRIDEEEEEREEREDSGEEGGKIEEEAEIRDDFERGNS